MKNKIILTVLATNFISSLAIVFSNKWLFKNIRFPALALVCFHFFCTSLSLLLCRILGVFKPKRIRWTKILPLSLSFCGFVVFTNISLQHNTIGTFQVLKCLADPMFIIIQTVFYKKTYSTKVKLTMLPMILGIVVNSMYDLRFSSTGTFYALLAVVITSVYTVWIGVKQEEFEMSPMQLLYYQAPMSCMILLLFIPVETSILEIILLFKSMEKTQIIVFLASGLAAFMVNLTTFWIIKNTSVITYATFGKLKLCTTMLMGFLFLGDPLQHYQIFGIFLTLLGVIAYSCLKLSFFKSETISKV